MVQTLPSLLHICPHPHALRSTLHALRSTLHASASCAKLCSSYVGWLHASVWILLPKFGCIATFAPWTICHQAGVQLKLRCGISTWQHPPPVIPSINVLPHYVCLSATS